MRHAASLESDRLQKVLAVLSDGERHGTLEIASKTQLCAVGSAISELRANGLQINCQCVKRGRFEYQLIGDATND